VSAAVLAATEVLALTVDRAPERMEAAAEAPASTALPAATAALGTTAALASKAKGARERWATVAEAPVSAAVLAATEVLALTVERAPEHMERASEAPARQRRRPQFSRPWLW
jgi:D-alanyl-D-alanine carboxypeptidase